MKNKKANLLIISLHADPSMPPGVGEWGGTHTYMRELLTVLCDSDYEVVLITRKVYSQQNDLEEVSENCRIVRLTLGNFDNFDKRELFSLHETSYKLAIEKLDTINFRPDIIHSVYWNSGHLAMRFAKLWNIPYVHSVISNGRGRNNHGASGTAPNRIETEEKIFLGAAFILCVAESEKNELRKYYNISPEKIVVAGQYVHPAFIYPSHNSYGSPRKTGINNKIEDEYFQPYSTPQSAIGEWWNKRVFTYTGRLSLDKGLHYIVQAWYLLLKKYEENCPPLWIIGGNPIDIQTIRPHLGVSLDELTNLEKAGKLVWWGYLDENGISAIYSRTLALITHSLYEPGGRVAVEAMCTGLPILATPNGFALDTINNWHNGFLIEYGDIETLVVRLSHFAKQPYLSNTMGYQAQKVSQIILYNWAFKRTHEEIYNAALKELKSYVKPVKTMPTPVSEYKCLHMYPFNNILVDNADIIQIMKENGIDNIDSVMQINISESSSFLWEVTSGSKSYIVKIPYDRINIDALWASQNYYPLVFTGLQRYRAEVGASSLYGIPVLIGKCDKRHALIREKYISQTLSVQEQFDNALSQINQFYKKNPIINYEYAAQLNSILNSGIDYKTADKLYKKLSNTHFPWQYHFIDYSLRVEALRWREFYDCLFSWQQQRICHLFKKAWQEIYKLALQESESSPIINHGGCNLNNIIYIPQAILLDNEKIHWGWPGIDYADILISYVEKSALKETPKVWRNMISKIPSDIISPNNVIAWLLLDACKKMILAATCLNPIPSNLVNRINLLLQLL